MRHATLLLLVLVGCGATAAAQEVSDEERGEGFVSMFNGRDFSGWRFSESSALPEPLPANWKVEEGLIKLSGGGSPHLGSQWDYEDFDMRFQWRAVKENYNSGFFIRSGRKVGANQINLAKGAEGNFFGGKLTGGKPVPTLQKPPMQWNEWRVHVVGDKVTFWCNGELAWEGTGFESKRGYIGLQAEGAPLEFRNLRIKELGYVGLGDQKKNWTTTAAGHWKQEGDTLVSDGGGSPLETARQDFKDYTLRLEWKGGKDALGAVVLHGNKSDKAVVQLVDPTAGLGGTPAPGAKPVKSLVNPPGEWNYLEIRLAGTLLSVGLNGTAVVEKFPLKTDAESTGGGGIALRAAGLPLQFRNVRIRGQ